MVASLWGSGARYSTTITRGKSGTESRNANWEQGLHRFNAAFGVKTKAEIETLKIFFHSVRGRHVGFLVKDYSDFNLSPYVEQGLHGVYPPNGVRTEFQLFKIYADELSNYTMRNITKPKQGSVTIYKNGLECTEGDPGGLGYTVNYSTGIVTFAVAPATGSSIFASFEFYVPARFDTDDLLRFALGLALIATMFELSSNIFFSNIFNLSCQLLDESLVNCKGCDK